MKTQLIKVSDLAGLDVTGKVADVRNRKADGSLLYNFTADEPKIVTLKGAKWDREKYKGEWFKWLRLRWVPDGRGQFDCGFSGMREDARGVDDWHILLSA